MSASQTTIITENGCNGGKDPRKSRSGAGTRRVCERSRTYLYLLA